MKILVTGGTGFLGTALLPHLIKDPKIQTVFLLMRPSVRESAEERIQSLIEKVFKPVDRVAAAKKLAIAPGDLTLESLGFDASTWEKLTKECTHIMHIGASTDFGAPIEESRFINVEGTRKLLDFALQAKQKGCLQRFDYISTAFVAGTKPGRVTENDLIRQQKFANAYEQSKFEAEVLVREYMKQIPITILRPSIVVGDSRNGFTPHFKVLYWPLQLLSKDILPFVPCRRDARLDIVPVDFVASSIYRIMMSSNSIGQTLYLTAGRERSVRIDEFLKDAFRLTDIKQRPLIPVWMFKVLRRTWLRKLMSESFWRTCELAAVYNDYLSGTDVIFDNEKSTEYLKSLGGSPAPHWRTYGRAILTYCMDSKWGKRLKLPEFEYRNPQRT